MTGSLVLWVTALVLAVHGVTLLAAWRRGGLFWLVPLVNGLVAIGVVVYWVWHWHAFPLGRSSQVDELFPFLEAVVLMLALGRLVGLGSERLSHWAIFTTHLTAAVFFLGFMLTFRMESLL